MAVLERLEGDELGQLAAQDLGMTTEVMDKNLRSLLILGEIATLVETARARRIHEEVRRPCKLDNEATRALRGTFSIAERVSVVQCDVLDEGEGILDLVASRIVVDVVSDAALFGRVEDDEVHRALTDAAPGTDGQ